MHSAEGQSWKPQPPSQRCLEADFGAVLGGLKACPAAMISVSASSYAELLEKAASQHTRIAELEAALAVGNRRQQTMAWQLESQRSQTSGDEEVVAVCAGEDEEEEDEEGDEEEIEEEDEENTQALQRLRSHMGIGVRVCILGSTTWTCPDSKGLVVALARRCQSNLGRRASFITGGMPGVQETFAQSCNETMRLWNLLPRRSQSLYGVGTDIHAGASIAERREILGQLGDIYVTVEGGPGVAQEARDAVQRGARVLSLRRTGGASSGMFDFPPAALEKPPSVSEEHWALLGDAQAPVEASADAAMTILRNLVAEVEAEQVVAAEAFTSSPTSLGTAPRAVASDVEAVVTAYGAAPSFGDTGVEGDCSFSLMTFNVEEYYRGYELKQKVPPLRECVFATVQSIREMLEVHSPDVICLEEHSLGAPGNFSEQELLDALVGGLGYDYLSEPTGEQCGWYSALANIILWKVEAFALECSWRVPLAEASDVVPGTCQPYTPRAAACAELVHNKSGRHIVICAAHLMGGRFEDKSFVAEALAGRNMRAEQALRIATSIQERCGSQIASAICGDFNVMRPPGYGDGSAFRCGTKEYFEQQLVDGALALASKGSRQDFDYDAFWVPFQTEVHAALESEALGYSCAYGRSDDKAEMKTTLYSGCIDWIYVRNLRSKMDEQIIDAIEPGLSDHDAVMVTLQL